MSSTLKVQNFYYTNVTSESIPSSGAFTFNVAVAPTYTNGFLVISAENTIQREIVYFHSVSGNVISVRAENRGLGGTTAKEHIQGESITMRDVAEIFNFYSDAVSTCFFTEKTGGLTVKVWGGLVYYNTVLTTVADTTLTLTDNAINYIKYSYTTNIISADTINVGNIKATIVVSSGVILSIVYTVAKETYTDFTVSLNTALPSQPGNAGKVLTTDGTNATWQDTAIPTASTTVKGVVEIATDTELKTGSATGGTGAPITMTPAQLLNLGLYGDGSDGDVVISSNTTLTTDKYYNNLTVNTGITLDPAGYAIYVLGTFTLTGTAKVIRNGNNGSNGSSLGVAGVGGTALAAGTCGINLGGVDGGAGGDDISGYNGNTGTSIIPSYSNLTGASGGSGGNGMSTIGGGGGGGGIATRGLRYNTILDFWKQISYNAFPARIENQYGGMPAGGGGGGGGSRLGGYLSGGGGGGSGGNGGIIIIFANTLSGTGTIESKGGAGGNGGVLGISDNGGGGGGAGGSGGVVILVYRTGSPYTCTLTGGTGGIGGTGYGLGSNGSTGTTGISILINK